MSRIFTVAAIAVLFVSYQSAAAPAAKQVPPNPQKSRSQAATKPQDAPKSSASGKRYPKPDDLAKLNSMKQRNESSAAPPK